MIVISRLMKRSNRLLSLFERIESLEIDCRIQLFMYQLIDDNEQSTDVVKSKLKKVILQVK